MVFLVIVSLGDFWTTWVPELKRIKYRKTQKDCGWLCLFPSIFAQSHTKGPPHPRPLLYCCKKDLVGLENKFWQHKLISSRFSFFLPGIFFPDAAMGRLPTDGQILQSNPLFSPTPWTAERASLSVCLSWIKNISRKRLSVVIALVKLRKFSSQLGV